MKLRSVTVRNYRIHKELTVAFDEALTVIGGPNEAGKTTIVEAVHRALFLRSRASGTSTRDRTSASHTPCESTASSGSRAWTVRSPPARSPGPQRRSPANGASMSPSP